MGLTVRRFALEGIDGSGKSTQVRQLVEFLRERGCKAIAADDDGRATRQLYRRLIDSPSEFPDPLTSVWLSLADHALAEALRTATLGTHDITVVMHRSIYSTFADAMASGMQLESGLVQRVAGLFPPLEVVFVVEVDAAVACERKRGDISLAEAGGPDVLARHGTLEQAFVAYQGSVARSYRRLAGMVDQQFCFVDGERESDEVAHHLHELVWATENATERQSEAKGAVH